MITLEKRLIRIIYLEMHSSFHLGHVQICAPLKCHIRQTGKSRVSKRHHRSTPCSSQTLLEGSDYDSIIEQLAVRALQLSTSSKTENQKLLIGIAGVPGSGKSTLASLTAQRINELAAATSGGISSVQGDDTIAVQLPMDGFHYYLEQLDAMPDPQEARARRGAHWTFDASAFIKCVSLVRESGEASCPSFDHAQGDPVEDAIHIRQHHRIVLIEGNYLLLDIPPWSELRKVLDDIWFVDIPVDVAMERVYQRQTSIGLSHEVSKARIASNDRPNAELIEFSKRHARVLIPSSIPFRDNRTAYSGTVW
ncbi:hypothetical protein CEUSTIGMA_g3387.t1 [Chlamydomonas eustigma]|uniref:Phosphoribulokinase/uridine kinase domain-containing protein n=1 Tax=Chlamydomonas eustigma TaxID=1157962 RepID=A0A250WYM0_9CHLO|nr:hypothetical protein CEUSTIGMA_g3387.t1 [Chlamydomonas eustigma]|eukprot:GAX75944.1 hypothetical protein CEUSTIGMA_g3387.t1 [Chlamydomonas eustigma]